MNKDDDFIIQLPNKQNKNQSKIIKESAKKYSK